MAQIPVRHHPRRAGKSKYGIGRTGRVLLDLLTVKFMSGYLTRPMHFMGGLGLLFFFLAFVSLGDDRGHEAGRRAVDMTGNPLAAS